jgi:hypothetical protein
MVIICKTGCMWNILAKLHKLNKGVEAVVAMLSIYAYL